MTCQPFALQQAVSLGEKRKRIRATMAHIPSQTPRDVCQALNVVSKEGAVIKSLRRSGPIPALSFPTEKHICQKWIFPPDDNQLNMRIKKKQFLMYFFRKELRYREITKSN